MGNFINSLKYFPIWLFFLLLSSCNDDVDGKSNVDQMSRIDSETLTRLAEEKQRIGAFEEGIGELNKALEIEPKYVLAHYRMGAIYAEWNKKDEAVKAFQAALDIDPDHVDSRLGLGSVYSKMVKNDLAVTEYEKVARLTPKNKEIYFKIALEYWYLQKLPETVQNYLHVIKLDPEHLQSHLNLASVYERMRDWPKTLQEIEKSLVIAKKIDDEYSISIAEGKLKFVKGRMNMTEKDLVRKTQPPFD